MKLHGRIREAILEKIRICKDQNVLSEYLSGHEKEVVDIMMTLFNEEYISCANVNKSLAQYLIPLREKSKIVQMVCQFKNGKEF